jgi:hypothetical protein
MGKKLHTFYGLFHKSTHYTEIFSVCWEILWEHRKSPPFVQLDLQLVEYHLWHIERCLQGLFF